MIKVLWCRFQQCFSTFSMLLVEGSSPTGHFRHLSTHDFGLRNFRNTKAMRVIFFSRCLKINLDFKNAAKNWEKDFCFWDNCICIAIVKLSQLKTRYTFSAANILTSSPKILHVNKREFFQLNGLSSDQWIFH